ncbi:group II intron reverse transcriptase/maturase [Polyangium sp. 6x1]|uniref:group II intron reverse transcriptase/maturase n=1 Tax=Polyangium sp. 6x1 TaxID=3042689 RepID=UPI002482AD19|nr:group II intron reverse transcriptase/maturase [Polyangium sp. 6x1]MDI1450799.1 group II intron reverse transcriptase/maturase [Polyangium sp. 6x1]
MTETPSSTSISTKLERIAQQAREAPNMAFQTLAHHIDVDWLREAYRRTRKSGATGVDGQTAKEYASHLEENLRSLLDRAKSGTYRAPPVRRVHIPKGSGPETRPLGIPTFEDKVLQRAVAMALGAVYEQDFLDCSYGFRPKRSAHQALEALRDRLITSAGGWILEVDIRKFFDNVDHGHLRAFLRRRVQDGVLLRVIQKWLHAGVLEDGCIAYPDAGTPQGGVISPLLANIFLHEVLDAWFEHVVKPRLRDWAVLVRYADDAVLVFGREEDARRVHDVLAKRFAKYGLTLHPEKTRLIPFRRPDHRAWRGKPGQGPGTFDLLGFTHHWGRAHSGKWVVRRRTARDRFRRSVRHVKDWCKRYRHKSMREQQRSLSLKLRGHYGYFGIAGNSEAIGRFYQIVFRIWGKWLRRRSQRRGTWDSLVEKMNRYPLPQPLLAHGQATAGRRTDQSPVAKP